ncbi:MAG: UpxY family transcription antiterminator [Flavobacteriia bacterium]|nr:UpxY family transcription antiterminator [Flavobacteriia bacterium]
MEIIQNEKVWYAFYTKSRAEKKVYDRLILEKFEAYLPLKTEIKKWSDRKKKVITPLISSYVFVSCTEKQINNVIKIEGIVNVLKYLKHPAIVYNYEIENLRILLSGVDNYEIYSGDKLDKGDAIEVTKGPFKGLIGELVTIQGKHRVVVEIDALQTIMVVNIPLSFVNKIVS